jgi:hypothetical protein
MTITVGDAATHNEKEVKTEYPVTEGTTAGTTKQEGTVKQLEPAQSNIRERQRVGL